MDLAELNLKVDSTDVRRATVDLDKLSKGAGRAEAAVSGFAKAILGMAGALTAAGAASVKNFANFEQTAIGMEALIGNAAEAKQVIGELREISKTSIFNIDDLTKNVSIMKALGTETKNLIPELRVMADAAAAFGGADSEATLTRLINNISEIRAQGRIDQEDIRRLSGTRIPILDILNSQLNIAKGDIRKLAEEGMLLVDDVLPAIFRGFQESAGGFVNVISDTLAGQFDVMRNNVKDISIDIGKELAEAFNLKGRLIEFTSSLNEIKPLIIEVVRLIAGMGDEFGDSSRRAVMLAKGIQAIFGAAAAILALKLLGWLKAVAVGIKAITFAMASNPFLAAAVTVTLLSAALAANWRELVRVGDETVQVGDLALGVWDVIRERVVVTAKLIATVWREFVWPRVKEVFLAMQDGAIALWKFYINAWTKGASAIVDIWRFGVNKMIAWYKSLFDTGKIILDALMDEFGHLWDFAALAAQMAFAKVVDLWKKTVSAISNAAPLLKLAFTIAFEEAADEIKEKFASISDAVRKELAGTVTGDVLKKIAAAWADNFDRDFVGEALSGIEAFGEQLGLKMKEAYEKALLNPDFASAAMEFERVFGKDLLTEIERRAAARRDARTSNRADAQAPQLDPLNTDFGEKQDLSALGDSLRDKNARRVKSATESFIETIDNGVRDAFVNGITDGIMDGDWQEALHAALTDLSRTAISAGLELAYNSALGTGADGQTNSLIGLLAGTASAVAGSGDSTGATAQVPGTTSSAYQVGKQFVMVNVIDEGTADATLAKATAAGATGVVMKGSGNPGVSAGRIRSGKR